MLEKIEGLQPREKAKLYGVANTVDHELLAILLGSGHKNRSVISIAKELVTKHPLATWNNLSVQDFVKIKGCGQVKSLQLASCVEIGKRIFLDPSPPVIRTSHDVHTQVAYLAKRNREEVVCLYLNARNELLSKKTIAVGGINYSSLHPRDVFSTAIALPCAQIIVVHNHPSGNLEPSAEDIQVTQVLQAAGQLLGIRLLDHVIIGNSIKGRRCVSMNEIGYLD